MKIFVNLSSLIKLLFSAGKITKNIVERKLIHFGKNEYLLQAIYMKFLALEPRNESWSYTFYV
jgi:hypothetical protein